MGHPIIWTCFLSKLDYRSSIRCGNWSTIWNHSQSEALSRLYRRWLLRPNMRFRSDGRIKGEGELTQLEKTKKHKHNQVLPTYKIPENWDNYSMLISSPRSSRTNLSACDLGWRTSSWCLSNFGHHRQGNHWRRASLSRAWPNRNLVNGCQHLAEELKQTRRVGRRGGRT